MAWLLGKAEDILNKVDQAAGTAIKNTGIVDEGQGLSKPHPHSAFSPPIPKPTPAPFTPSASVPSNLSQTKGSSAYLSQLSRNSPNTITQTSHNAPTTGKSQKQRDKDEELFEFLNTPETSSETSLNRKSSQSNLRTLGSGKHSRQSSISSTVSNKSSKASEVKSTVVQLTGDSGSTDNGTSSSTGDTVAQYEIVDEQEMAGSFPQHDQQLSALELENRLLKNEVQSLNQEMTSVIKRAKDSQDELARLQRKTETANSQLQRSDGIVRELQAQVNDLTEALNAKDAQLGVLRVRFEEADKKLSANQSIIDNLSKQNERILADHTSSSGVQSQALESIKDKLSEAEERLRQQEANTHNQQSEAASRQSRLETELQHLSEQLASAQRRLSDEKSRNSDAVSQYKSAKNNVDLAKQELAEYKEKASRILQSKDKLIASLKEGGGVGSTEASVSNAELESMAQEMTMLKEEVQHSRITIDNLRLEHQDLEVQLQQETEQANETRSTLDEQLTTERQQREDAELDLTKHKQELRYAHEELLKQKTGFQSRLQDREAEIDRLRNQLTTKSLSSSSQAELENRLHSLTESLIHKQTTLEALSTEKNSLVLQLERLERQNKDLEVASMRTVTTTVHMHDDDDARQRLPTFMRESPADGEVTRRVKRAYSTVDTFSIRMGVFLRRYPMARVFVVGYMALLHVWVMIVLLTYQPEIHSHDFNPQAPGE